MRESGGGEDTRRHEDEPLAIPRFRVVVAREDGQPSSRIVEVEGETVRIGSHPSNDVVLTDPRVSPFHCSLTQGDTTLRLNDHGSQHGTWVSGLCVRDVDVPRSDAQLTAGASLLAVSTLPGVTAVELYPQSHFGRVVGGSTGMRRLFAALSRASQSAAPLWIDGESGSGATLIAEEVVRMGARHGRPFFSVSSRAFGFAAVEGDEDRPDAPLEARGALERALSLAGGGSLLLENIEDLPPQVQGQLLRFLEVGAPDGGRGIDGVRIVVTSGRSLARAVNRGLFREDLYLALSRVANVRVPPLRERLEDVPLLIQTFLAREHPNARSWRFASSTLSDLRRRDWPGNVRELFDYVGRALGLDEQANLAAGATRPPASEGTEGPPSVVEEPFKVRKERLIESFEREYLQELMTWAAGNVSRAARKARIDRMYLHRLLVRHGIERGQFPPH